MFITKQARETQTPSVTERRKKTLGETRLSRGASSPPARRTSSLFQLQQSQCKAPLVPVLFSTARHGSLLGGFPLGTVPGTFLALPRPRFQAIRTVTQT